MKKSTCFLLSLYCFSYIFGQTIDFPHGNADFINPETIVEHYFNDPSIQILDVRYEGVPEASGYFVSEGSLIGIEEGLVLSTGITQTENDSKIGIEALSEEFGSVNNISPVTDDDLLSILGPSSVNNISKMTITFIPKGDSLFLDYVFASEEYPEYVCSQFNDLFGVFLSGPGVDGPFENNAINIATIPNSDLPVAINSINHGEIGVSGGTAEYCFGENGSLDYSHLFNFTNLDQGPVYGGFTNVLTARARVQACETYQIKLVIADAEDEQFDSGVFFDNKSFKSTTNEATVFSATGQENPLVEGCSEGGITITLPDVTLSDSMITYTISGTAINGEDYETLNDSHFTIPAGENSVHIPIIPLEDSLSEAMEELTISIQENTCTTRDYTFLIINPTFNLPNLPDEVILCADDENVFEIDMTAQTEISADTTYDFVWRDSLKIDPADSIHFIDLEVDLPYNPIFPDFFESVCIDSLVHPWIGDLSVYLIAPSGKFISLIEENEASGGNGLDDDFYLNTCFTMDADSMLNPINASTPFTPMSFSGNYLPRQSFQDLFGEPINGTWRLGIIDGVADAPMFAGDIYAWSIHFKETYTIDYEWQSDEPIDCSTCPIQSFSTEDSSIYVLTVSDSYQCEIIDTFLLIQRSPITAGIVGHTTEICEGDSIDISFSLPDSAMFQVHYTDGLDTFIHHQIGNGEIIRLPNEYEIDSVRFSLLEVAYSDGSCSITTGFEPTETTVEIHPMISATIHSIEDLCNVGTIVATVDAPLPHSYWTINNNGIINAETGEINLEEMNKGSFMLTYQNDSLPCFVADSLVFEVLDLPEAVILPIDVQCAMGTFTPTLAPFSALGGTWAMSNNGFIDLATGEIDLENSPPDTYTVTYIVGSEECMALASEVFTLLEFPMINIEPIPDQGDTGVYMATLELGSSLGGIWSINNGGLIHPTSGEIDLAASGPGVFIITYTVANEICGNAASTSFVIEAIVFPDEDGDGYTSDIDPDDTDPCVPDISVPACQVTLCENQPIGLAGADFEACTADEQLSANLPEGSTGFWMTNTTAIIADQTHPNTMLTNLGAGENLFVWTLSTPDCPDYFVDSLLITYLPTEILAVEDGFPLTLDSDDVSGNILMNDELEVGRNYVLTLTETPHFGQVNLAANGDFTYSPDVFSIQDTFTYTIAYEDCPDVADTAKVSFSTKYYLTGGFIIHQINHPLQLPENVLSACSDSEILIFNVLGEVVYKGSAFYQNGFNSEWLSKINLRNGVYYYRINIGSCDTWEIER